MSVSARCLTQTVLGKKQRRNGNFYGEKFIVEKTTVAVFKVKKALAAVAAAIGDVVVICRIEIAGGCRTCICKRSVCWYFMDDGSYNKYIPFFFYGIWYSCPSIYCRIYCCKIFCQACA